MDRIYLFLIGTILMSSCQFLPNNNKEEISIARVYDKYLTTKNIEGLITKNTSKEDSIRIVNNYVESWVQQQLLLHQAEMNMEVEDLTIQQQIEDYRNSLVIYEYEQKLVSQKVDTSVSEEELSKYYEGYSRNFLLKNNIIKLAFIKVDKGAPKYDSIKFWFKEGVYHDKLKNWCNQYAGQFSFDTTEWHQMAQVRTLLPTTIENEEQFLLFNSYVEQADTNNFSYFMNIHDYRIKNGIAPLSYVQDDIESIILNKRKVNFVQNLYLDLYKKAFKNKEFEIF